MKLKDYVKLVIEQSLPGEIRFEINLYSDCMVSDVETGNKITFTVTKKDILDEVTKG